MERNLTSLEKKIDELLASIETSETGGGDDGAEKGKAKGEEDPKGA